MKDRCPFNLVGPLTLLLLLFACSKARLPPVNSNDSPTSGVELLESIENAFVGIAERSNPAVVGIIALDVKQQGTHSRSPNRREGTGFIFRQDGYILTNNHVVSGAGRITVRLFDGREFEEAQLVGVDPNTDVAVLKIDAEELPVLPFADSDSVKVGQFAIAIGNPFQLNYTVTTGIVSGKGRILLPTFTMHYQDFIQTDAWINRGNSGGPLLNIHGEVIGINAAIRRSDNTPAADAVKAGAGFAIPINLVKKVSDQLIANGQVIRGWLGIRMVPHAEGIRVTGFSAPPSPAKQGGMEAGDIIVEYNGQETREMRKFRFLIAESMVGEAVAFTVIRDGVRKKLSVTVGRMPRRYTGLAMESDSASWTKLGIAVRELAAYDFERHPYLGLADEGVIVEEVRLGGPAPSARVALGTLIVAINDQRVKNMADYDKVLQKALDKSEITFEIKNAYTEKGTEIVTVKINR